VQRERSQREDLFAIIEARRELGEDYDAAFVDSFVDRITRAIDARVDEQVATLQVRSRFGGLRRRGGTGLAVVSLILAIPLSAIAGAEAHLYGLLVAWGGIGLINAVHGLRSRSSEPRRF
jgi:hypothetical protein